MQINAFYVTDGKPFLDRNPSLFHINDTESIVINSRNEFELALILKAKEFKLKTIQQNILDRLSEKRGIISRISNESEVCLIGHSQIDYWGITELNGKAVRNCGIAGISSFEYNDYILNSGLLSCTEETYVIMHGTNDIIYGYSYEEICASIQQTVAYIKERSGQAKIYFIQCLHVNGRMDRSNQVIDGLNEYLSQNLRDVIWIDVSVMDDEFGNLNAEYTADGLHLSELGYSVLRDIVEKAMEEKSEENCDYSGEIRF